MLVLNHGKPTHLGRGDKMRPRISQAEITELIKCLEFNLERYNTKLVRLTELREQLLRLRLETMQDPNAHWHESDWKNEHLEEYTKLKAEKEELENSLNLYESLRAKFSSLSKGKTKGRYEGVANDAPKLLTVLNHA